MTTIEQILDSSRPAASIIADLKDKAIIVPSWVSLLKEYDPKKHPVMSRAKYPDIVNVDGTIEYVTGSSTICRGWPQNVWWNCATEYP
jgi:hypothetical protein